MKRLASQAPITFTYGLNVQRFLLISHFPFPPFSAREILSYLHPIGIRRTSHAFLKQATEMLRILKAQLVSYLANGSRLYPQYALSHVRLPFLGYTPEAISRSLS